LNESTGTRFQRLRRTGQVVSLSVGALWLLVVITTPAGRSLARWAEAVTPAWTVVTFVVCLVLVWEVVALPAGVYAAVRGDQRFRKGRTPVATIVGHQVRDALTGTVVAVAGALVVWTGLDVLGPWWWVGVGVLLAPLLVGATALAGVTVRATSGSLPVTRDALVARLSQMAEQACGRRIPVREWTDPSTSAPTARVTGIGASGAILLSRSLVTDWSDDEIAVVVAHELSHHAHHDLWRTAALDTSVLVVALGMAHLAVVTLGPALGVTGMSDPMVLPLIGGTAWAMWWVLRPVRLAQSRAHERTADRYAIAMTGNPEAFRAAVRRLAAQHLAEERPSALTRWFFHRHPTVEERLRASEPR
jgi:STE24 endopeptidase